MHDIPTKPETPGAIAVLGTGRMGAAAARRLLTLGHEVTVWNRTAARAEQLRDHGAKVARNPAEAADGARIMLVFLADSDAVDDALLGASGAAAGLQRGAVVVQMSTIGPDAIRRLAARLPDGIALLDAPVKGSVPAVEAGILEIYVGGDEATLASVSATLIDLGTVVHCGGVGSASALKLVVNASMILAVSALAEVISAANALDVPAELIGEAIAGGPLAGALRRAEAPGADFPIAHARKDLSLARKALDTPLSKAAEQLLAGVADQNADLGKAVPRL